MSFLRNSRSQQRGFTLFEALLSVALTGVIMFALSEVTSIWLPNWRYGLQRVQQTRLMSVGLERLVADIEAAEFISSANEPAPPLFEGDKSSLLFVRSAIGPNARHGLEIIRIAEKLENRGYSLVRTRAIFAPSAIENAAATAIQFSDPVTLVQTPYRVTFSYAGPDRIWKDSWRGGPRLPSSVQIVVRDSRTNKIAFGPTTALIHVNISSNCIGDTSLGACVDDAPPLVQR
jgi:general secretion pathway protein J